MSTDKRNAVGEELFRGIPIPDIPGAEVWDIDDCGGGVYARRIEHVKQSDYRDYIKTMEEAGFIKCSDSGEDLKHKVYNASFGKENQMVALTYNGYWNRIYITTYIETFPQKRNVSIMDKAVDYGAGNHVTILENAKQSDYREYKKYLEKIGFTKYADNGQGLYGKVFNSTYTKENVVLTITYVVKTKKLYISACEELPLSEHLLHRENECERQDDNKKTSLHMLQMQRFGNSFVIQLKNGHFIISDGGWPEDLEPLIEYLEELTIDGGRPIVEAWFISHAHVDHCGVFKKILEKPELAKRIFVEGVYFNEPNDCVINLDPGNRPQIVYINEVVKILQTTHGNGTNIYRPQTGQRYYFDDITVDILVGQEQLELRDYSGDLNDSSTWCMCNIEGQKVLLGGDGERAGVHFVMDVYDKEDITVEMFSLLHHGHGTRNDFTEFCSVDTVLVTTNGNVPAYKEKENMHFKSVSKEWISWGEGTRVFTFPYKIGTSKIK